MSIKLDSDSRDTLKKIALAKKLHSKIKKTDYSNLFKMVLRLDEQGIQELENSLEKKRHLFLVPFNFNYIDKHTKGIKYSL